MRKMLTTSTGQDNLLNFLLVLQIKIEDPELPCLLWKLQHLLCLWSNSIEALEKIQFEICIYIKLPKYRLPQKFPF